MKDEADITILALFAVLAVAVVAMLGIQAWATVETQHTALCAQEKPE